MLKSTSIRLRTETIDELQDLSDLLQKISKIDYKVKPTHIIRYAIYSLLKEYRKAPVKWLNDNQGESFVDAVMMLDSLQYNKVFDFTDTGIEESYKAATELNTDVKELNKANNEE